MACVCITQSISGLKAFILPGPSDSSRILAEEFQAARIAFELKPAEFIRYIEKFSKILKTRDLCDLLMEYFERATLWRC